MVKIKQQFPKQEIPSDPTELSKLILQKGVDTFISLPPESSTYAAVKKHYDEQLKLGKKLNDIECPSCKERTYSTLQGLRYHLINNCPQEPVLPLVCKICEKKFEVKRDAKQHVKEKHLDPFMEERGKRERTSLSLVKSKDEESEDASDDNDDDYDLEDDEYGFEQMEADSRYNKRDFLPEDSEEKFERKNIVSKTIRRTYELQLRKEKDASKIGYLRPDVETADDRQVQRFLSSGVLQRSSCKFSINTSELQRTVKTKKKATKRWRSESCEYQSLGLFQSRSVKNSKDRASSFTSFVGGSIWCMEWAPTPTTLQNSDQFLAIATHDKEHLLDSSAVYEEETMIQIWNCGPLPYWPVEDEIQPNPFLSLGILIESGPIWDMAWRGVYDNQADLGLGDLALASGIGEVIVVGVPFPTSQYPEKQVVRPNSYLRLLPNRNNTMPYGQCLSVCWSTFEGKPIIAAGFVSGHVAIFDVATRSSLLLGPIIENCQIIYPLKSYHAHSHVVRSIEFCPYNPHLFATGSFDRKIKVWDMKSLGIAIMDNTVAPTSFIYEIQWEVNFNGIYAATGCEFVQIAQHGCIYYDISDPSWSMISVVPYRVTSWSVSVNPWFNSVVSSDSSGSVVITFNKIRPEPSVPPKNKIKLKNQRRIMMYQCRPKWQIAEKVSTSDPKSSVNQDWADDYQLKFDDMNFDNLYHFTQSEAYRRSHKSDNFPEAIVELPVGAVLKCRWNPNFSSFSWVATGTRAGFLRLHCITGLVSQEVRQTVNSCTSMLR